MSVDGPNDGGGNRPALTKIVATIGPASSDRAMLAKLIDGGVSVFRINFSHGGRDEHTRNLTNIREVASSMDRPIAVLGDLQGPRIRLGPVAEGGLDIPTGADVIVQRDPVVATPGDDPLRFSCTYERLIDDVRAGERLLVSDGTVRMLIVARHQDRIECTVTHGGHVATGKGINLPESELTVDVINERDWDNVAWAVEHDVDFLALSFVRHAGEVRELAAGIVRLGAGGGGTAIPIVAKIEHPRAVENIEEIVDAADAIMIARGDLGVEMELTRVPVIQRQLARIAQSYGKPCIVATQMLESMIESPNPTRAEVNDVAGAIFDGVDAVMLSGETAIGRYPQLAVEIMRRTCRNTEEHLASVTHVAKPPGKPLERLDWTAAIAHGVWIVAQDTRARFIVVWSEGGSAARYLSQNNFQIPVIALTSNPRTAVRTQLFRGVIPVCAPIPDDLPAFTRLVDEQLLAGGWARVGDTCVLVAGGPTAPGGLANSLALHRVGEGSRS